MDGGLEMTRKDVYQSQFMAQLSSQETQQKLSSRIDLDALAEDFSFSAFSQDNHPTTNFDDYQATEL